MAVPHCLECVEIFASIWGDGIVADDFLHRGAPLIHALLFSFVRHVPAGDRDIPLRDIDLQLGDAHHSRHGCGIRPTHRTLWTFDMVQFHSAVNHIRHSVSDGVE